MGKSTSCFKLIACGGDAADKDDFDDSQVKDSNDKRGWSFRKRSARHRVLSNTVISEAPCSVNRENPERTIAKLESPSDADKITTICSTDVKANLSTLLNIKQPETFAVTANDGKVEDDLEESVAVVIQTAIRGLLAQKELLKLKNAVKLQAAVRGHLVRRHAVGTLRCVQAIMKMQALVRARQGKENHLTKRNVNSVEKILSNSFARHLLECTPKNKRILIKCDPSRGDSTWKWLERWMSIITADFAENKNAKSLTEQHDVEKDNSCESHVETEESDSDTIEPSPESGSTNKESILPSEIEDNMITYDANNFTTEPEFRSESAPVKDDLQARLPENMNIANNKEVPMEIKSHQYQGALSDVSSQKADDSFLEKPEVKTATPRHCVERFTSEQLDTDEKKQVIGSRKPTPSFITAHSKFEELSSSVNSGKSNSSSHHDTGLEVRSDVFSSEADTAICTKEFQSAYNSVPFASRVQVGGSECGTELSVTSTLDSPDISETGVDNEHEGKCTAEYVLDCEYVNKIDIDARGPPNIAVSSLSKSISDQTEILENANANSIDPLVSLASENSELKMESKVSVVDGELDSETVPQDFRVSLEASPRSHVTIPESQGTPSSQVSVKTKGSKTDKAGKNNKRMSLSRAKESPAHAYNDSGLGCSGDEMHKDRRTGKRRNSFGLVKPDQIDQEPRDSSSSKDHFIPHFMQATESARAKMHANNSPRSSPDIHDQDIYIKKRHSLPSVTARQGSPRIQRSTSQAQQEERKWQR